MVSRALVGLLLLLALVAADSDQKNLCKGKANGRWTHPYRPGSFITCHSGELR